MRSIQTALFFLLLLQGIRSQETRSCLNPSPLCCSGPNGDCYRGCYCDEICVQNGDCCSDYTQTCVMEQTTYSPTTAEPPTSPETSEAPLATSANTVNQPQKHFFSRRPHVPHRPHLNTQKPHPSHPEHPFPNKPQRPRPIQNKPQRPRPIQNKPQRPRPIQNKPQRPQKNNKN